MDFHLDLGQGRLYYTILYYTILDLQVGSLIVFCFDLESGVWASNMGPPPRSWFGPLARLEASMGPCYVYRR